MAKRNKQRKNAARRMLNDFTLSFGRHRGQPLRSVPRSYLRWALTQSTLDPSDLWAIREFLGVQQPELQP